jgi:iron(III) transport system permease protein
VPAGSIGYWLAHGGSSTLPGTSIASAIAHTALYSAAAAALATVLAIPVVMLCTRHRTRFTVLLERLAYLPMALPGIVVALGLVSFTIHHAFSLYQSSTELIAAYAILFLPLALVGVRSSIGAAPARLEELARSLGAGPATVWRRVTLPLIAPGLAVAFALVFISSATELTATLVLRPTGVNTLATRFWAYTSELSYGSAAPYAALMVAVSAIPAYLLSRRLTRATGTGSR